MKRAEKAFDWIISILRKHKIHFHVTGGLAAKVYGSPRPLVDINIELHDEDLKKILPAVKPYLIQGPVKYHDDQFNIFGMSLTDLSHIA